MASCKKGTGTLIWPELKELGIHCLMYVAAIFFLIQVIFVFPLFQIH